MRPEVAYAKAVIKTTEAGRPQDGSRMLLAITGLLELVERLEPKWRTGTEGLPTEGEHMMLMRRVGATRPYIESFDFPLVGAVDWGGLEWMVVPT